METQSDDKLLRIIWDFIVVEAPLRHADVIVVGGNKNVEPAECAAELYNLGFAPLIVFSGFQQPGMDMTEAELYTKTARKLGVPASAILSEDKAINTGQNITLSQQLLESYGITPKTVILVHVPDMSRRFLATAEVQWPDPKPDFISRHESIEFMNYLIREGRGEAFRNILGNFQRMRSYAKKGYQSPQEIPADVQEAYDTLLWRGHKTR